MPLLLRCLALWVAAHGSEMEALISTELLQHQMLLDGPWDPPQQRLRATQPISWLHFPKAGSSFINMITHLPGVCRL